MKNKIEFDQAIKNAYLDMAFPNFAFVMEKYNSLKYKGIITKLSSRFDVRDNTELNNDVCFSLEVVLQEGIAFLYMSFVGQYAFIIFKNDVITKHANINADVAGLIDILLCHEFMILDKEFLLSEVSCDICPFLVEANNKYLNYLFARGLKIK